MAIISFETKHNIKNKLWASLVGTATGGDMVHCEIVLNNYNSFVCSAWSPSGVQIREFYRVNPENWINFDIGNHDMQLWEFFNRNLNKPYNIKGIATSMIFNLPTNSQKKICSQLCYEALMEIRVFGLPPKLPETLSPHDVYEIVKAHNFQINNNLKN